MKIVPIHLLGFQKREESWQFDSDEHYYLYEHINIAIEPTRIHDKSDKVLQISMCVIWEVVATGPTMTDLGKRVSNLAASIPLLTVVVNLSTLLLFAASFILDTD
ncbi:hypothetical protein MJO29_010796 [Puccinia striiformis f. sp. tritici]|nr:hypothetical protein MJO29_010796 [Puccinia striiformis f. sp. tritici]